MVKLCQSVLKCFAMFISANIQFAKFSMCRFLASSSNFLEGSLPYQVKVNTSYNGKQVIIKCLTLRDHQIKDCQQEQKANMYSLKRTCLLGQC